MLPIDKFDRRMDAEHLENNTMDVIQINELREEINIIKQK